MRLRLGCSSGGVKVSRYLSSSCFPGSDGVASSIRNSFFFPSRKKKKVIMYVRYVLEIGE